MTVTSDAKHSFSKYSIGMGNKDKITILIVMILMVDDIYQVLMLIVMN